MAALWTSGAMLLLSLTARLASASVDASALWDTEGHPFGTAISIRQTGTVLHACAVLGTDALPIGTGTIDPETGAFTLSFTPGNIVLPGGYAYCSITWTGTVAQDSATFSAVGVEETTCVPPPFSCSPQCLPTATYQVSATRIGDPAPCCGDTILDASEACDDGNTASGDCCSSSCQFEPAGTRCVADSDLCTGDACDGAGRCVVGPPPDCGPCRACDSGRGCIAHVEPTCRFPGDGAFIDVVKGTTDARNRLRWKWRDTSGAVSTADFGDPLATTGYDLCVFFQQSPGSPRIVAARVAPDGAAWQRRAGGFVYRDRAATQDGIARIVLRAGAGRPAQLTVKGKGAGLALPFTLPTGFGLYVRAQLQARDTSGACWDSIFASPEASTAERYRAAQ